MNPNHFDCLIQFHSVYCVKLTAGLRNCTCSTEYVNQSIKSEFLTCLV